MAERILYAIASLLCQTCHLKGTLRHARVVGASCQTGRSRGLQVVFNFNFLNNALINWEG